MRPCRQDHSAWQPTPGIEKASGKPANAFCVQLLTARITQELLSSHFSLFKRSKSGEYNLFFTTVKSLTTLIKIVYFFGFDRGLHGSLNCNRTFIIIVYIEV